MVHDTPSHGSDHLCLIWKNPSITVDDTERTRHAGRTDGRTDGQTDGRTDRRTDGRIETSIPPPPHPPPPPPTTSLCGGYNKPSRFWVRNIQGKKVNVRTIYALTPFVAIAHVRYLNPCFLQRCIWITCDISISANDKKCKYDCPKMFGT